MDTELIFAVSRRFNNPKVDELYALHIEPVLQRYGIILTCDFASEDAANVDYWMNRMNVVLDLADIHIILDLNRARANQLAYYLRSHGVRKHVL